MYSHGNQSYNSDYNRCALVLDAVQGWSAQAIMLLEPSFNFYLKGILCRHISFSFFFQLPWISLDFHNNIEFPLSSCASCFFLFPSSPFCFLNEYFLWTTWSLFLRICFCRIQTKKFARDSFLILSALLIRRYNLYLKH